MSDSPRRNAWAFFLVTALSLSVGWGIRGNFGHEYGAMIPGAMAAMAAVLLSGRDDWHRRIAFFAMFGALGWSFGGSISYMQVIGYTHSGHSPSVLYGFACLFVIGFLWAALGGAGTAFPAVADRDRLTELFLPFGLVLAAWWLQGVLIAPWLKGLGYSLDWYDTDWLAALLALITALLLGLIRRGTDRATSLILHMALGWWIGFVVLVLVLGLRMTPPRGDNWAGCLGMTAGVLVYCLRTGLPEVAWATLVSGFIGGMSFASASMFKLVEVTSGFETNWHSVLEQTTGLFNGLGIAVVVHGLSGRTARIEGDDDSPSRRWAEPLAVGFVLLAIPYINLRKNVRVWVESRSVPSVMYGIPAWLWFELAFAVVAVALAVLMARHQKRPLPVVPESWLGKGQGLYLVFAAILVIGNFERAVVGFADQRLITEGVIHVNALICAVVLLTSYPPSVPGLTAASARTSDTSRRIRTAVLLGVVSSALVIVADWAIVRAIYGDRFAGHAGLHIRFGPNATVNTPDPQSRGRNPG